MLRGPPNSQTLKTKHIDFSVPSRRRVRATLLSSRIIEGEHHVVQRGSAMPNLAPLPLLSSAGLCSSASTSRNCTFIITGARTGVTSAAMTDHHAAPTQTLAPNLQRSEQRKLDHRQSAGQHVQPRRTRWREHEHPHMSKHTLRDCDS